MTRNVADIVYSSLALASLGAAAFCAALLAAPAVEPSAARVSAGAVRRSSSARRQQSPATALPSIGGKPGRQLATRPAGSAGGPKRAARNVRPSRRGVAGAARSKSRPAPAVHYSKRVIAGTGLHLVQFDPRRRDVRLGVALAGKGLGYRDSWSGIIDRTRPTAALTGTYFCTESSMPVGSLRLEGENLFSGPLGTVFAYSPGRGAIIQSMRPNRTFDASGWSMVVRAGPRLLTRGRVTLYPEAEGFRDPAVTARKRRTAVAITAAGKLLLVAVEKPMTLRTLAHLLARAGAVDAMALDGGDSTGLYFAGRTRVAPHRALTNLLVLYQDARRYQAMLHHLAPSGPRLTIREEVEPAA